MEPPRLSHWDSAWRIGILTLTLIFAGLAIEITKTYGVVIAFDTATVHFLASLRTPIFTTSFIWITQLGSAPVVASIVALSGILLISKRKFWAYIAGYAVSVGGAVISGYILKILIDRARPDNIFAIITETSGSFPSGHATIAMALYGFLAYLLYVIYPTRRIFVLTGAGLIVSLIGFSRLYLGVHFPSDVLAGYALGGIWLILGVETVRKIKNRIPPAL